MSIKITFGTGYFALNGAKYPKGHYLIQGDGDTLNIYSTDGNLVVSSKLENFVDSLDAPFATMDDLLTEFDSAFSAGGGDGEGVTLDGVETLTNKTISGANNTFSDIPISALDQAELEAANYVTSATITSLVNLTQAQYDAIVTPDENTLYFIVG